MLDFKQASTAALAKAMEMFGDVGQLTVEEAERETYQGRDVWSITVGFPSRRTNSMQAAVAVMSPARTILEYKRFLIDAESGEFVALKIRSIP